MARITVIPDDDWEGELAELYPRVVDRTWDLTPRPRRGERDGTRWT